MSHLTDIVQRHKAVATPELDHLVAARAKCPAYFDSRQVEISPSVGLRELISPEFVGAEASSRVPARSEFALSASDRTKSHPATNFRYEH